ncbi:FecCD family ABC transporter permease [Paenibacillus cymbidii]|uniref:FecCD family ABC transporter permease n=1 Tax=Paenibacillus cymbidii TaxID=1639034 RepID=UPI0010813B06
MPTARPAAAQSRKGRLRPSFLLCLALAGTLVLLAVSVSTGAASIPLSTVIDALFDYDGASVQHYTILSVRLPRAIVAIAVGSALAVSGAIMQGITRNPLASPGIMGVSAGSAFAVVVAFVWWPVLSYHAMIVVSMSGAAIGAAIVYGAGALAAHLGSAQYARVKLALAGAAVSALFGALSEGIQLYFGIAQDTMFWYAAGISGVKWAQVQTILPWLAAGMAVAMLLSGSITLLGLGEDTAAGLGLRVRRTKLLGALAVFALTGSAVAIAGPIGFIGLVVPHLTRFLVGIDYRWVIPCSAVLGGLLLLAADTAARLVNPPQETPVGVLTALIGVPFFLYLARREGKGLL